MRKSPDQAQRPLDNVSRYKLHAMSQHIGALANPGARFVRPHPVPASPDLEGYWVNARADMPQGPRFLGLIYMAGIRGDLLGRSWYGVQDASTACEVKLIWKEDPQVERDVQSEIAGRDKYVPFRPDVIDDYTSAVLVSRSTEYCEWQPGPLVPPVSWVGVLQNVFKGLRGFYGA